jgi:hypothetical protein
MALALPFDLPNQNAFMSINFEANYALPTQSTHFTQDLYEKILFVDGTEEEEEEIVEEARKMKSFSFFSRRNVYKAIEQKLSTYGFNGHVCLLRFICEVGESNVFDANGVVGNLFHILFT